MWVLINLVLSEALSGLALPADYMEMHKWVSQNVRGEYASL